MAMAGDSEEGSSQADLERGRRETCVAEIRKKIGDLPSEITGSVNRRPSIWRAPPHFRKLDCDAYEPKLVSTGPLHHGKTALLPMEEAKLGNLYRLLNRSEGNKLDFYVEKIFGCLSRARDEYSVKVELSDEKFAEMLVIDGCFLVDFIIQLPSPVICTTTFIAQISGYLDYLWRDIMLLENQIPFFVLEELFEEIKILYPSLTRNLVSLALRLLGIPLPPEKYPKAEDVRHLLHLRHLSMNPGLIDDRPPGRSYGQLAAIQGRKLMTLISVPFIGLFYIILFRNMSGLFRTAKKSQAPVMIPSATELLEAGVKFKRKATPEEYEKACQLKVSFVDGTIEIPFFVLIDLTRSELRNAVAFEQCRSDVSSHFSSYCTFLDKIIDTPDDVAILRKSGILVNMLGSDAEVAEMFNSLVTDVFIDDQTHYNAQLFQDVAAFCELPHHRWRANLVKKYFSNPWTVISLIAGLLLLIFTREEVLQMIAGLLFVQVFSF